MHHGKETTVVNKDAPLARTNKAAVKSKVSPTSNNAPWKRDHCGKQGCTPYKNKEGSCKVRNITYIIKCTKCQMIYWGETHRTWGDRAAEHTAALRTMDDKNPLVKHQIIHHPDEEPSFSFKIHKSWISTLARQIGEALAILQEDP